MQLSRRVGLGLVTLLGLTACTNPEYSIFGGNRVDLGGARQMIGSEGEFFTAARLADMVNAALPGTDNQAKQGEVEDGPDAVRRLDTAFANFADRTYRVGDRFPPGDPKGPAEQARRRAVQLEQYRLRDARNTIQAQLIAASNNRCNVYKQHLSRFNNYTQFTLGSAATIAGGAGALLSGGATQAASAVSGILSGVNSEFQKDFMANVMTNVIVPGIDRQRADLRNNIVAKSCHSVAEYPLPLAIAEVIRYHGACNVNVGIAASGQAVTRTQPDSLASVLAAVQLAGKVNKALTNAAAAGGNEDPAPSDNSAGQDDKAAKPVTVSTTDLLGSNLEIPSCPALTSSGRQITTTTTSPRARTGGAGGGQQPPATPPNR